MAKARFGTYIVAAVASALGACATTKNQVITRSAAGNLPPRDIDTVGVSPTIPALSANDQRLLNRMTDANILGHLATEDSLEVAMAQVARRRTQNAAVSGFARRMILEHSTSLLDLKAIADRRGLSMQIAPGDTNAIVMFRLLDSLKTTTPDGGFDRWYITSQIDVHQRLLAELQTLHDVARDESLKRHIEAEIPVARSHLARAVAIGGPTP
jgi:putative membrane protein